MFNDTYFESDNPVHTKLKQQKFYRQGQWLDPSIATPDEVDHRFCQSSVFARTLQHDCYEETSQGILRSLKSLPPCGNRSKESPNFKKYQSLHSQLLDLFCLLDYQVMPMGQDPFSQFKTVNRVGKEKLPRPPHQIRIQQVRYDISTLSELLRHDLCTELHPDLVHLLSAETLMRRYRVVRGISSLLDEYSIMLAPYERAFLWRDCEVCSNYDFYIIRFFRDFYRLLLRIFHDQRNRRAARNRFALESETSSSESNDESEE